MFSNKEVQLKVLPPLQVNLHTIAWEQPWKMWKSEFQQKTKRPSFFVSFQLLSLMELWCRNRAATALNIISKPFHLVLLAFVCKKYILGLSFMVFSLCFMYVYIKEGSSFFFIVIQTNSRLLPIANPIIMQIRDKKKIRLLIMALLWRESPCTCTPAPAFLSKCAVLLYSIIWW